MKTYKPDYSRQIAFARKLRFKNVRIGNRRVFWVSYPGPDGPCKEFYLTAKQARIRAMELAGIKEERK